MPQTKASIGIDWGTHSSKWTWVWSESDSSRVLQGPYKILRSEVCLEESTKRIFLDVEAPRADSVFISSVKGKLIQNPDQSFWAGRLRRIKLTLGELVSFSLWFLLGEAYQNLCSTIEKQPEEIGVRFSLPNWVDIAEGAVGRACYEQAAKVACHMFAGDREAWSRTPHLLRDQWQEDIQRVLQELSISDDSEIDTDRGGFRSMIQRDSNVGEGVRFRFVAESSAAGLAALRVTEEDESKYLRKILVVDVGAGSTDIGYVIRSIPRKDSGSHEALCQFPPANTCQIAGNDLTRRIVGIYRSRGEDIGFDEAESRKIVGEGKEWLTHPAVTDWVRSIAEHVQRYVSDVPDRYWLRMAPGLQVLITGGSGIVDGLRDAILSTTKEGLKRCGVSTDVIDLTSPMTLELDGPAARDANRLAVALGASSEDLPRLTYIPKMDSPMPKATVRAAPSWTG